MRPPWLKLGAASPAQMVRQPDWGFQDQPLTRKSSDWESTNIGSRFNGPANSCPGYVKSHYICSLNSVCSKTSIAGDSKSHLFTGFWVALALRPQLCTRSRDFMTLKIERIRSRIRLSGEFRSEQLAQVKAEIELCESPTVLDLEELNLVDVEAVRFLNACETKGISVSHCSPYISEWMLRERSRPEARARKRKKRRGDSEGEHGEHR